jgi:apolipoprotein N-acyltransferase
LDRVLAKHPDAQILVLSEYAFDGPIPNRVKGWCRTNSKYLIAGGKEEVFESDRKTFHNTAFVIGPNGEVTFQQGKSVPIQFFNDGLPARDQRVWHSPWGPIAIPTCYDLSYRRVTDHFVTAGAKAFIVPFMDVADWGEQQHRQHTRIAPMRAREYHLSIFRLGSSGISQHVDGNGKVLAEGSFPGQEEIIAGELRLANARPPIDRWLAPLCSAGTAIASLFLGLSAATRSFKTVLK